jgi:hypothetical protein
MVEAGNDDESAYTDSVTGSSILSGFGENGLAYDFAGALGQDHTAVEPLNSTSLSAATSDSGLHAASTMIEELFAGDRLDLSEMLDANFGQGNDADGAGQENAAVINVQLDSNPPASGANFEDPVVLAGYGTSNADLVRSVFNASEQQQLSA